MAFTSAMTIGTTWTGLLSNNQPRVRKQVTDLFRRQRHMLPLYQKFGRLFSDDAVVQDLDLFIENEDQGLVPITTGYETTTPTATDAPHGAPIRDAKYLSSIQVSEIDLMDADNMNSVTGIVASRYYKKWVAIEKDWDEDMIVANNVSNSGRIYGLEQLIPPYQQKTMTGDGRAMKLWELRQCANTVQGVARTAWTSATAGGTGFESISFDGRTYSSGTTKTATYAAEADAKFAITTSLTPNPALQMLLHLCFLASDGGDTIDALLMSPTPYEDLMNAEAGKIRYMDDPEGSNGAFKYARYRDYFCIGSSNFRLSGLIGTTNSAALPTAGVDVIWGINFQTLAMKFASNGFFRETDWKEVPMSPLAYYMAFFVAGQHKLVGRPDRNFCWYNYGLVA